MLDLIVLSGLRLKKTLIMFFITQFDLHNDNHTAVGGSAIYRTPIHRYAYIQHKQQQDY